MKKGKVLIAVLLVIVLAVVSYVAIGSYRLKAQAKAYLTEKGYATEEIQSIKVGHSFLNLILSYDEWNVSVQFKDEPEVVYYLTSKNKELVFRGTSGGAEKRSEKHIDRIYPIRSQMLEHKIDYVGDNSGVGALLSYLPTFDENYKQSGFEITKNKGLIVFYERNEKSSSDQMVFSNEVETYADYLFECIDNLEYIEFKAERPPISSSNPVMARFERKDRTAQSGDSIVGKWENVRKTPPGEKLHIRETTLEFKADGTFSGIFEGSPIKGTYDTGAVYTIRPNKEYASVGMLKMPARVKNNEMKLGDVLLHKLK